MLLSRIFSLLLGTTLFVMIWTMQDGDHAGLRMAAATELRPMVRQTDDFQQAAAPVVLKQADMVSVSSSPASSDQVLWMFADEATTQIAVK